MKKFCSKYHLAINDNKVCELKRIISCKKIRENFIQRSKDYINGNKL